jgi:ATP-dependent protease Clp ATPase subunit
MRDVMFDIPSDPTIVKCIITKDTAENHSAPKIEVDKNKKREPLKMNPERIRKAKNNKTA